MIMTETVRLRLVFEDQHMLSKSKKKEGLQHCWCLLKTPTNTVSDVASYIVDTFRLHRTCPDGIILSMDGFVLPPFESRAILKDKDIVCVKRKGRTSTASEAAMLTCAPQGHHRVELPKLLANDMFQEDTGGYKTMSEEDNIDSFKDTLYLESKSPNNAVSKKRKATKKLRDSRKKIKLSSCEKLADTPKEPVENNGSFRVCGIHHQSSLINKENGKSSNLSSQTDKSMTIENQKQSNGISELMPNEARFCQPEDGGRGKVDVSNSLSGTKKTPSRSARRKKAQRQWLREQLKLEKEKLRQSPLSEKNVQQLPVKDNKSITSDLHREPVEESDAEDDVVAVEIRPGHIRFEPLSKNLAAPQNQFPMETFRWNGITNKKKMQKWGIEKTVSHKVDYYKHSNQECFRIQNAEEKEALMPVDFDKLISYTGLPKEGDVIAYRLIELSSSWTPEISSFRVGKISWYDPDPNRIRLEAVPEYPFDFGKKADEEVSSLLPDSSPYGEDGSLEIDYSSLVDVRVIKHGNTELANAVTSSNVSADPTKATKRSGDELMDDQTAIQSCHPHKEGEGHAPAKVAENRELNVWDEINEALTAKKAKLSLENGWNKEQNSGSRSWSHRSLRCSALGPTVALLRAQDGLGETDQQ
ncbi:coilin [Neltuma alba]|uniref:coilin n=1 Tax=Neltuma alba TaxID=207710 RepID=UPI0010A35B24|nr:coilin [Prosopis alba]